MKIVVLISSITEWLAVKETLAPDKIQANPYGEYFTATIRDTKFAFFHAGWGKTASASEIEHTPTGGRWLMLSYIGRHNLKSAAVRIRG